MSASPQIQPDAAVPAVSPSRLKWLNFTGVLFAVLQSACAAVLAISGLRVAIGLSALAVASGTYAAATGLHQDAIRFPMLALGSLGAILNLAVLIRVWRLRARSSAGWRRRKLTTKERRSERLQFTLAVLTLALVAAELITHPMVHRKRPPAEPHTTQSAIPRS